MLLSVSIYAGRPNFHEFQVVLPGVSIYVGRPDLNEFQVVLLCVLGRPDFMSFK